MCIGACAVNGTDFHSFDIMLLLYKNYIYDVLHALLQPACRLKFSLFRHTAAWVYYLHGGSMKSKPNCLCHIYLMHDHIKLKLSRELENSTKNMITASHNLLFNRSKDMSV